MVRIQVIQADTVLPEERRRTLRERLFGLFTHIYLFPLAVVVVFTAIFNWNSFMSPLVFINTTEKLPVAVGIQMVLAGSQAGPGNTGAMMAASTLITIPVIMLFAFSQKYFMQGIVLTGLSGR